MSDHTASRCVICGLKSNDLEVDSFRPTLTLDLAMNKLCEAMFVPSRHVEDMLEILSKENLYCMACLSALNAILQIQDHIIRLDAELRKRGEIIGNAILEANKKNSEENGRPKANGKKSSMKTVQDTVIENFKHSILPIRPTGKRNRMGMATNSTGIPVAAVLPIRKQSKQRLLTVKRSPDGRRLASTLDRLRDAAVEDDDTVVDASVLLCDNQRKEEDQNKDLYMNTMSLKTKNSIADVQESQPRQITSEIQSHRNTRKQPVKRKLFRDETDSCTKTPIDESSIEVLSFTNPSEFQSLVSNLIKSTEQNTDKSKFSDSAKKRKIDSRSNSINTNRKEDMDSSTSEMKQDADTDSVSSEIKQNDEDTDSSSSEVKPNEATDCINSETKQNESTDSISSEVKQNEATDCISSETKQNENTDSISSETKQNEAIGSNSSEKKHKQVTDSSRNEQKLDESEMSDTACSSSEKKLRESTRIKQLKTKEPEKAVSSLNSKDTSLAPEQLRREAKKCPRCDFKMHYLASTSEYFSYKANESKKKADLMIVDHYGKHHLSIHPHNVSVDEHGLPFFTCPTCKYKALPPPSRNRSYSPEPAEVKRAAFRSLVRHFLNAHEIY